MADSEARKPNGFLVFLGTAVALTAVIVIVGGLVSRRPKIETVDAKRAQQRIETREKLEKAAHEQLTTADWVDKAKGVVRLPVEDAIKVVATELAAKKPAPSQVKVDAPLPMPPPYDPNSKEPPISALPSAPQGADTIHFDAPPAPPAATPAASPPPAAAVSPASEKLTASVAPNRPPLIHFTENSEPKQ
jgi:hypothetical protein